LPGENLQPETIGQRIKSFLVSFVAMLYV